MVFILKSISKHRIIRESHLEQSNLASRLNGSIHREIGNDVSITDAHDNTSSNTTIQNISKKKRVFSSSYHLVALSTEPILSSGVALLG